MDGRKIIVLTADFICKEILMQGDETTEEVKQEIKELKERLEILEMQMDKVLRMLLSRY